MRRRRSQADEHASVDVTPMLDIVFILLVFFFVMMPFKYERGITWAIGEPVCGCSPIHPITVEISARNEIRVMDIETGEIKTVSRGGVREEIQRHRAALSRSVVVIGAHPDSDMGVVVFVLDQARQVGAPTGIQFLKR